MSRNQNGTANHMATHTDDQVHRARTIYSRGNWSAEEVRQHLADEDIHVAKTTLIGWLQGRTRIAAGGPQRPTPTQRKDAR